jgi:hypothetical protein
MANRNPPPIAPLIFAAFLIGVIAVAAIIVEIFL